MLFALEKGLWEVSSSLFRLDHKDNPMAIEDVRSLFTIQKTKPPRRNNETNKTTAASLSTSYWRRKYEDAVVVPWHKGRGPKPVIFFINK